LTKQEKQAKPGALALQLKPAQRLKCLNLGAQCAQRHLLTLPFEWLCAALYGTAGVDGQAGGLLESLLSTDSPV
jgi:hypothetical protein